MYQNTSICIGLFLYIHHSPKWFRGDHHLIRQQMTGVFKVSIKSNVIRHKSFGIHQLIDEENTINSFGILKKKLRIFNKLINDISSEVKFKIKKIEIFVITLV